ncbi:hypothetical protein PAXRUDRAFT_154436, partial [Paxillus rubicundulus Ve08.2h10]
LLFIFAMQSASLDDEGTKMDVEAVHCLQNPPEYPLKLDGHKIPETTIKLYLGLSNIDSNYDSACKTFMEFNNLTKFPSLYQIKSIISQFSGIGPVVHDMCYNLCVGFMGPFSKLNNYPKCSEA